ncbi:MAG: type I DNA topoisomerase [Paludibacteraceae bacterium]|nr:type I DNA topoisomerase [Paludibacteraceae bacterium]
MQKNLVIVESPAKAKTIEKFLGNDYTVLSSFGHIRDLKKKGFGIDVNNNYAPDYEISSDKKELVKELKKKAKESEVVWLASDEDREGEAIAWHLYEVLGLKHENTRRIVFHEITKDAILNAIKNPRDIDINLVSAQQARRVLDRIVGFELSPILWKKVKPSLSAGRVQSVTVRLIVDREREIKDFKAEAAYRILAVFNVKDKDGKEAELKAELQNRIKTKEEAYAFLEHCKNAEFQVESVSTRPLKKSPAAPFTTSTLQQEASRKLGFSVSQTMMIAQKLYESGKITYMRTDSVNLSSLAINTSKAEILEIAGEKYLKIRNYHTKSLGAQEAHEAIRPTYMNVQKIEGTSQEMRLYELIWKRTIASQMADAELEKTSIVINVSGESRKFIAEGEVLKFDGFLKVYMESTDDENEQEDESLLPPIKEGDKLDRVDSIVAIERFSQRPPRYTEASLVKKLEELGIGRPSTYATTVTTIQNRGYVERTDREGEPRDYNILTLKQGKITDETKTEITGAERSKLFPTDIGIVVNDFLIEYFPNILDYNFTAKVEKEFDDIAEGHVKWEETIDSFYKGFHPMVEDTIQNSERKVGERQVGIDPQSGKPVFVKIGRFGPVAQIGTAEDEEKPKFASLRKDQHLESVTFEEVMDLFKLPREIGTYEDTSLTVGVGRFGAYVRHAGKFYSLKKTDDPLTIDCDRAIELIEEKRLQERNKIIKTFDAEDIQICNGRFGPYIAHDGANYKIPKTKDPQTLTLEECQELIKDQADKKPAKKKAAPKKSAEKAEEKPAKATAKKSTTKTATKAKTTAKKATTTAKSSAKKKAEKVVEA